MKTKNSKFKLLVIVSLLYLTGSQLIAQTIGGPGWVYDSNGKVNSFYEGKQKNGQQLELLEVLETLPHDLEMY